MAGIRIFTERLTETERAALIACCPFRAIALEDGALTVGAGCRLCKICLKAAPPGAVELFTEEQAALDKSQWRGVTVFAQLRESAAGGEADGGLHPVVGELLAKARELAAPIGHPVCALLLGDGCGAAARALWRMGADRVYAYDDPLLREFAVDRYAACFEDYIQRVKPCAVLVGATTPGRSLAPRVAARLRAGLTADCTQLLMRENTDLVQIRPAFGGGIMAQIVTPRHRPQFCTVRYQVFAPLPPEAQRREAGELVRLPLPGLARESEIRILSARPRPREADLTQAPVIVAAGRGLRAKRDLQLVEELAEALGGTVAGTRPLVEAGWIDPRRQIGLSGRTVKPRLIVTCGISGSVQFAAGMRGADCIVAVNNDPRSPILDIAHYGVVGDLYEVLPRLLDRIRREKEGIACTAN